MPRIAITQRVSTRLHGQPHDCLDQSWADFFVRAGFEMVVLPNLDGSEQAIAQYLSSLALDGLVLSGGNDIGGLAGNDADPVGSEVSARRDAFERAAVDWAVSSRIPVVGVCRGLQVLNVMFGGQLGRVEGHAGSRHAVSLGADPGPWFAHLPKRFEVNSFHNFAVHSDALSPDLMAVAVDASGNVEALRHRLHRLAAIMWHPERGSPFRESDILIFQKAFAAP